MDSLVRASHGAEQDTKASLDAVTFREHEYNLNPKQSQTLHPLTPPLTLER